MDKILAEIKAYYNSGKQYMANSEPYPKLDDNELEQRLLKFDKVHLSLSKNEAELTMEALEAGDVKVIKDSANDPQLRNLYGGYCSCKQPCGKVINLMVAGQTGAGKTTLIDCYINFLLDVELNDSFRYRLVDER